MGMIMKRILFLLGMASVVLTRCAKEVDVALSSEVPVYVTTLSAEIGQPQVAGLATRTTITTDKPHKILWKKGDQLYVKANNDAPGEFRYFTVDDNSIGKSSGTFSYTEQEGTVPLKAGYTQLQCIYASDMSKVSYDENSKTIQLTMSEIMGINDENNDPNDKLLSLFDDFVMTGETDGNSPVRFICPFGLLHMQLKTTQSKGVRIAQFSVKTPQMPELYGTFAMNVSSETANYVAGSVENPYEASYTPIWTNETPGGVKYVQLSPKLEAKHFYLMLPAGEYPSGTTFEFTTGSNEVITKQFKESVTLKAGTILNLPLLDVKE